MSYVRDTIVARATAPGRGGIGIVRVSGPAAPDIARRLTGSVPKPRYATFNHFRDSDGQAIDHGIVLYFPGPDSFTGEDVLELQGHGSPVAMDMLVSEIVAHDTTGEVRLARPGEFSERAFLNDKMDLAQAEAVADLIDSSTREAARGALRTLEGEFSDRINELQAGVTELRVYVEAAIDFPDEEVDFLSDHRVTEMLDSLLEQLADLASEAQAGSLLTEGASVVLLGRPNAGKSSLMNRLTGRDTSIVTAIPGTTRDRVDEHLQLDGIPLRLVDTAGIRSSDDEIEAEGVRRALAAAATADL
ncbi:MAG: tRNA uridine-5-carboxymethylaminomethyl(34) synthesis GTPase MnmE, partial [Proteobacteria bacterium]|nr:tRNA uridine-5-carboxymethylaminomethyl(34) synthesis GTPase MnmE [Pseudomonadota bacterium]